MLIYKFAETPKYRWLTRTHLGIILITSVNAHYTYILICQISIRTKVTLEREQLTTYNKRKEHCIVKSK